MKFETKAIRIQTDRSQHKEHSTPIFPTSSFVFDSAEQMQNVFKGEEQGNIYSRFTNPSVREFEMKLSALEGTEECVATASGMAAVFASFVAILKTGDHIISSRTIFGSTFQVLSQTLLDYGIECDFIDDDKPATWSEVLRPNTKMFYLETPTNPGLNICDLERISKFCKTNNLLFAVDNCFASPYLQNPLKFGADIIIHSATKFIDGQGRVLGGAVCSRKEITDQIFQFIRRTGASLSPFNAWVLSKSLETLAVRLDRHCSNAMELANRLESHSKVKNIRYPHLKSHPQFELAKKQMSQGGGIITFEYVGSESDGLKFLNQLKLISLTANLGDSRTIASHPASTTHLRVPAEEKLLMGVTNNLIRISVGLEHIDDIHADIIQALDIL